MFCHKCGKELIAEAVFCPYCRTKAVLAAGNTDSPKTTIADTQIGSTNIEKAEELVEKACELRDDGKYQEAIRVFNEAIKLDPSNGDLYLLRGDVYKKWEKYDDAIRDFSEAIKLDPSNADLYMARGLIYDELGDDENIIKDFSEAIKLDPSHESIARWYVYRGTAYQGLENYEDATRDFNEAIRLDPLDASTYDIRGTMYFLLDDFENAIKDFTEAVRLDPDNKEYRKTLKKVKRAIRW